MKRVENRIRQICSRSAPQQRIREKFHARDSQFLTCHYEYNYNMITSVDYKSLTISISLIISGGTQALNVSDPCVVVRMKKYTN